MFRIRVEHGGKPIIGALQHSVTHYRNTSLSYGWIPIRYGQNLDPMQTELGFDVAQIAPHVLPKWLRQKLLSVLSATHRCQGVSVFE